MEIKTFRAKTMPQALDLVRQELGPEAMVLLESAVEEILGLDRAELRRIA